MKETPDLAPAPRRILVLGSDGHGRGVKSYRWDKLPHTLNVADFDVVILNFAAFEEGSLAAGFPPERLPSVESMTRLVFSANAEVIAIGDPSTRIGASDPQSASYFDSRVRADYWLPFYLGTEEDSGTQYTVSSDGWAGYFAHLSAWSWITTGTTHGKYPRSTDYLTPVTDRAHDLHVALEPIAQTRYAKPVAVRVHLSAVGFTRFHEDWSGMAEPDPDSAQVVAKASPVYWLPSPDRVTASEAIDTVLRERFGIAEGTRVPDWVTPYVLPDEIPIAAQLESLELRRQALEQEIAEAEASAAAAALPRLLLYEKGKDILEPVVRDILRLLGARVEDPVTEGVEDGTVFHDQGAAVLEIKGRSGPIKQDDVRQVVQWASDAKLRDGTEYKPLIVGNPYCAMPLRERRDTLAPNAATYATNGAVAVITTVQLFEALRQQQSGTFDESGFWAAAFAARGVVDLDVPNDPIVDDITP